MALAKVLTIRTAARRLGTRSETVHLMLVRGDLTSAQINDKPAVLDDLAFRRAARKAAKEAA
jgi:hypothetical protein